MIQVIVSKPILYATDIQIYRHTESHMEVAPPPKNITCIMLARYWTLKTCESPKYKTEHAECENYDSLAGEAGNKHSGQNN